MLVEEGSFGVGAIAASPPLQPGGYLGDLGGSSDRDDDPLVVDSFGRPVGRRSLAGLPLEDDEDEVSESSERRLFSPAVEVLATPQDDMLSSRVHSYVCVPFNFRRHQEHRKF
mmetsp:Transcript_31629/g.94627  ORF Transcript_31629/g.94627 Transcript_31629/m.94627 type:complete len:113 (-) Transcript_31629:347-685(-)